MSVDAAAIAARLQQAQQAGGPSLCLVSSAAIGSEIKQGFSGTCRLPQLLPLPQLFAAAVQLPAAVNSPDLPAAAALLPPLESGDDALLWRIYDALRPHCGEGYSPAARLQLAKKLAALFGEVDRHLPLDAGDNPFAALRETDGLSHEGEVAAAVWELLGEEVTTRQPRLHALAEALPPLLAVRDEETTPAQLAFYERCGAEVVNLQPLPLEEEWRAAFTLEGEMPGECRHHASEGVGETLTQTAQLALTAVGEMLAALEEEGGEEENLGIVVHDRLLARRLRAIAEAENVLIGDKSGWRAETLSYGAAVAHCAQVLLGRFSLPRLRQLLQPPFYGAWGAKDIEGDPEDEFAKVAQGWQKLFADALVLPENAAELHRCADHAEHEKNPMPELAELLRAVARAQEAAAPLQQPAAAWLTWFHHTTADMLAAWRGDAVAQTLNEKLARRAGGDGMLGGAEFLLWLEDALQSERVSEGSVTSRVEFVEPGSRRKFGALLLLGCTGQRGSEETGWLGEGERTRLRLPSAADRLQRDRCRFSHHLAHHTRLAAVWCKVDDGGKPQPPNPFWRLFADHCRQHSALRRLTVAADESLLGTQTPSGAAWVAAPAPIALPPRLALSAADTLMKCPYLFFSQQGLQLRDEEKAETDGLPPRLAGVLLHRALAEFSRRSRDLQTADELLKCWHDLLREKLQGNRPGLSLLLEYWLTNSGWLIEWELKRRQEGWRTRETEHRVEAVMTLEGGAPGEISEIMLSGRIDRWDENAEGAGEVIDYKSGQLASKKILDGGEAPQLPLYAFFAGLENDAGGEGGEGGGEEISQMLCRPIYRIGEQIAGRAQPVQAGGAPPRRVAARLRRVLRQVAAGTPLPANGTLSDACKNCPAAGLCRREYWQD